MKIIVIDPLEADHPSVTPLIVTAYAGCEVITIGDEVGYRATLAEAPPGLLIITEQPKWCECHALLKEIRLSWPGVPMVIIAGDGNEEQAVAAIKAGLSAYLSRHNLEQLLKIVGPDRRSEQYQQFLAEASVILASSLDYEAILQHATRLVVPFLADSCVIDLIEDAQVRRVAVANHDPDKEQLLYYLARQFPVDLAHDPFAAMVRSGKALLVPDFMAEAALLPEAHEEFMRRVGPTRSLMLLPLIVRGEPIGAMIFGITDTPRHYGQPELGLAEELVRRLAITIDNAWPFAESQRLTRQARAQAAELEAIFQHAPVGLSIFDTSPGLRCLRHNTLSLCLCSDYWQRRGSYEGVLLSEMLDPEAYRKTQAFFEQALASRQTVTVDEFAATIWPDPQVRYYSCSATPLLNENDELVALLVAVVEITTRKRAEEERLVLERKLLDARKLESLGVLAGGIAHDFNNLLTVMIGNIDLALLDAPPNSPCAAAIRQIEQSAQRAAGLTRQLLTYAGGGKADIQPLDLNTMIVEMMVQLHALLHRQIELNTSLLNGLPQVSADQAQIQQLLMNLVVNAAEAMAGMPGTITIRTAILQPDRAWLTGALLGDTLAEGRYALLEVSDSGPGMDAATRERIFEPFFTTRFAGRGLGLSAVLGIVRAHRGALKVVSEPGQGATFTILLPCFAAVPQGGGNSVAPAAQTRATTILVVDDEPGVREVVSAIVRRLNFQVLAASDGLEALDIFRDHADEIDCVVLDMVMPHMDGAQTFVELQRIKPQVQVIVISGYSPDEMLQRFGADRPAGFLQKPFTPRDLRAIIQQLIGQGS